MSHVGGNKKMAGSISSTQRSIKAGVLLTVAAFIALPADTRVVAQQV